MIKLLAVLLCLVAVCHCNYQIESADISNPSCKYVLAEILSIDKQLLNLSQYVPQLEAFGKKYKKTRAKRTLPGLDLLGNETVKSALDALAGVLTLAPPCLVWLKDYIKFWIHGVVGKILTDQLPKYFEWS